MSKDTKAKNMVLHFVFIQMAHTSTEQMPFKLIRTLVEPPKYEIHSKIICGEKDLDLHI